MEHTANICPANVHLNTNQGKPDRTQIKVRVILMHTPPPAFQDLHICVVEVLEMKVWRLNMSPTLCPKLCVTGNFTFLLYK